LTRPGNVPFGTAILAQSTLRLNASFTDDGGYEIIGTWDLIKGASFLRDARLTIQNNSTYTLVYVGWGSEGMLFPSLQPSASDTVYVAESSAYVNFTIIVASGIWFECRTQEMVTVSKGDNKNFNITNNTLVVDLNDTAETAQTIQAIATSTR
jgi:hypothetical protein